MPVVGRRIGTVDKGLGVADQHQGAGGPGHRRIQQVALHNRRGVRTRREIFRHQRQDNDRRLAPLGLMNRHTIGQLQGPHVLRPGVLNFRAIKIND